MRRNPVRGQGTPLDLRRPILISPQEPRVTLTVGNKLIDFLIDMGATYSVVNTKVAQKTSLSRSREFLEKYKTVPSYNLRMPTRGPHPTGPWIPNRCGSLLPQGTGPSGYAFHGPVRSRHQEQNSESNCWSSDSNEQFVPIGLFGFQ